MGSALPSPAGARGLVPSSSHLLSQETLRLAKGWRRPFLASRAFRRLHLPPAHGLPPRPATCGSNNELSVVSPPWCPGLHLRPGLGGPFPLQPAFASPRGLLHPASEPPVPAPLPVPPLAVYKATGSPPSLLLAPSEQPATASSRFPPPPSAHTVSRTHRPFPSLPCSGPPGPQAHLTLRIPPRGPFTALLLRSTSCEPAPASTMAPAPRIHEAPSARPLSTLFPLPVAATEPRQHARAGCNEPQSSTNRRGKSSFREASITLISQPETSQENDRPTSPTKVDVKTLTKRQQTGRAPRQGAFDPSMRAWSNDSMSVTHQISRIKDKDHVIVAEQNHLTEFGNPS